MTIRLSASEILNPGRARGRALVLGETLSFWGGFDPADGRILDRHHPQSNQIVTGKVLVLPSSRGSAGTPAAVAESIRRQVGPVAIVLTEADTNIAIGAMVADWLYRTKTPVLVLSADDAGKVRSGDDVTIDLDGTLTLKPNRTASSAELGQV